MDRRKTGQPKKKECEESQDAKDMRRNECVKVSWERWGHDQAQNERSTWRGSFDGRPYN